VSQPYFFFVGLGYVSLFTVGMLRGLLERAILLFAIVDLTSVNGTAFRQVRVARGVRNPHHRSFLGLNKEKG